MKNIIDLIAQCLVLPLKKHGEIICLIGLFCGFLQAQEVEFVPGEISNESTQESKSAQENQFAPVVETKTAPSESTPEKVKPVESIQQLWNAFGVSDSQWQQTIDGTAWDASQNNLAAILLYTSKRFPPEFIEKWLLPSSKAQQMLEGKDVEHDLQGVAFKIRAFNRLNQRGNLYHLKGTAEAIEKVNLIQELQQRLNINALYFVAIKLDCGLRTIVITDTIPKAWKLGDKIAYPVSTDAYFVKYGTLDEKLDSPLSSYFVSQRIAWHPNNALGNLGMDFGLFDDLDTRPIPANRKIPYPQDCTLNFTNRNCLYGMLIAAKNCLDTEGAFNSICKQAIGSCEEIWNIRDPRGSMVVERQSYPVESLFNDPIAQRGQLFWLTGQAKRIVPVPIEDDFIRSKYGIDKYYNIYLFTNDSDDNPLVILTLELPSGVKTGDGPGYSYDLSMPCFFFNTWMYKHQVDTKGKTLQLAPLLIAPKVLEVKNNQIKKQWQASDGIFLIVLLIIAYFFIRTIINAPKSLPRVKESFDFIPPETSKKPFDFNFDSPKSDQKETQGK